MSRPPKYISEPIERKEKSIFNDIYILLEQGAPYRFIQKFLEGKYNLDFSQELIYNMRIRVSDDDMSERVRRRVLIYVRRLVNKYVPTCIICGKPKYRSRRLTFFCKEHVKERLEEDQERIMALRDSFAKKVEKEREDDPQYWVNLYKTHGDLDDIILNKFRSVGLGTSTLGPHRQNDFGKEAETIEKEMKREKTI